MEAVIYGSAGKRIVPSDDELPDGFGVSGMSFSSDGSVFAAGSAGKWIGDVQKGKAYVFR